MTMDCPITNDYAAYATLKSLENLLGVEIKREILLRAARYFCVARSRIVWDFNVPMNLFRDTCSRDVFTNTHLIEMIGVCLFRANEETPFSVKIPLCALIDALQTTEKR